MTEGVHSYPRHLGCLPDPTLKLSSEDSREVVCYGFLGLPKSNWSQKDSQTFQRADMHLPRGCPVPCVPSTSGFRTWGSTAGNQVPATNVSATLISSRGRCGCALPSQIRAVYGLDAGTEEQAQGWRPATQTDPANSLSIQLCVQTPGWLTYAWKGQSGRVVLDCLAHPSFSPLPCLHRSPQPHAMPVSFRQASQVSTQQQLHILLGGFVSSISLGAPSSGKSFGTDVPVQFCVLVRSLHTGDLPGARLLCLPSDSTLCLLHRTVPPSRQSSCSSHRSCVSTVCRQ